ncbi:UNVERIFIED_CONTAM: hypothetical protein HDU68_009464 [Siphonaria sp. JEL0065]|nr:hypothetical protein HDU68_009464 [Siphonaria sp. JEL0065]
MKVSIIGCGLNGAALALALKQHGHEPTLYDKFDIAEAIQAANGGPISMGFGDVGGGVLIQANGLRMLKKLGVLHKVIAAGYIKTDQLEFSKIDGSSPIFLNLASKLETDPELQHSVQILRSKLHNILMVECQALGVRVFTSKKLLSLQETETEVVCSFEDGTSAASDLVVGADGMHSATRRQIFGEDSKAEFTGVVGYLGVTKLGPGGQFGEIAEFDKSLHISTDRINRKEVTLCKVNEETISFTVTEFSEPDSDMSSGTWRPYSNLPKESARLATLVESWGVSKNSVSCIRNASRITPMAIYQLPLLPTFSKGRVVLVGDAAHGMRPNVGQGLSMGLEDVITLVGALNAFAVPEDLDKALTVYNNVRLPRIQRMLNDAQMVADSTYTDSPFKGKVLHFVTRVMISASNFFHTNDKLVAYDPTEDVATAVAEFKK